MRSIYTVGCLLLMFASVTAYGVETQSTSGGNAPEIGPDNSAPPPAPVASEDTSILICPTGGGRQTAYEVTAHEAGANCQKSVDAGVNNVSCWVGNRWVGGASCGGKGMKPGCQAPNNPGIFTCGVTQGRVTK